MSAILEVGDVVRLKSGGPQMTVYELLPDAKLVACIWYDVEGLARSNQRSIDMGGYVEWNFHAALLEKHQPKE